ncbi:hypothetical protein BDQ12DRAFT_687415 [Crucibulum laeve]|uniref:F-box domain-containing protein n=1 Tax=Crucibulum laeve TaxID=68775 RepID=A0A5C3LU66_9AGAR|nr:hypothetical protein BDQ12DRAFT_687415 [Crucibulum laeve]
MNLTSLPEELLSQILALFDYRSLLKWTSVCRLFYLIIRGSAEHRLVVELAKEGMLEANLDQGLTPSDRLKLLYARRQAWASLKLKKKSTVIVNGPCNAYELVAGVFAKSSGRNLFVARLPNSNDDGETFQHDLEVRIRDFAIDPTQDLLVLMEDEAGLISFTQARHVKLHLRTLSANKPHPAAAISILEFDIKPEVSLGNSILTEFLQLADDVLAVFITTGFDGARVLFWNWKDGVLITDSNRPGHQLPSKVCDLALLSPRAYMLTSTAGPGALHLYSFEYPCFSFTPRHNITLHMPPLKSGFRLHDLSAHSGPFRANAPRGSMFTTDPESRILVFSATYGGTHGRPGQYSMFMDNRTLMHFVKEGQRWANGEWELDDEVKPAWRENYEYAQDLKNNYEKEHLLRPVWRRMASSPIKKQQRRIIARSTPVVPPNLHANIATGDDVDANGEDVLNESEYDDDLPQYIESESESEEEGDDGDDDDEKEDEEDEEDGEDEISDSSSLDEIGSDLEIINGTNRFTLGDIDAELPTNPIYVLYPSIHAAQPVDGAYAVPNIEGSSSGSEGSSSQFNLPFHWHTIVDDQQDNAIVVLDDSDHEFTSRISAKEKGKERQAERIDVPWSDWGSKYTRFFPRRVSMHWLRYVHGMRMIDSQSGTPLVRVLDFNVIPGTSFPPLSTSRNYLGQHNPSPLGWTHRWQGDDMHSTGATLGNSAPYGKRVTYTKASTISSGIFLSKVETRLPYHSITMHFGDEFYAYMIDEDRIIGLKRAGSDEDFELHIFSF